MAGSANIISRLQSRLVGATGNNRDMPDLGTRYMGGRFRSNQPYFSGYFQVMFELPDEMFGPSKDVATKWLHSSCESFQPPGITINPAEVNGLGQIKSRYYASRSVANEFSCAFREYQNLPVLNIIRQWTSVFDPHTGVSPLKGNKFTPEAYKGTVYVIQTKPVGAFPSSNLTEEDVEEAWIFDGAWPMNEPSDMLASDLSGSDTLQYTITFSYDGFPFTSSEGAIEKCVSLYETLGHSSYMDGQHSQEDRLGLSGSGSVGG